MLVIVRHKHDLAFSNQNVLTHKCFIIYDISAIQVGHRGDSATSRENTLGSLLNASRYGATVVELGTHLDRIRNQIQILHFLLY
jgi:hypothetical protein